MKKTISFLFLFLIAIVLVAVPYNSKAQGTGVTVDVRAVFDEQNNDVVFDVGTPTYGSQLNVTLGTYSGYEFAFWIVDGIVRQDLTVSDNTFIVTNNLSIIAVYHPTGRHAVVFVDYSGKHIETKYAPSGTVSEPLNLPDKNGYDHASGSNKWLSIHGSTELGLIEQNSVFKLQYVLKETQDQVTITANNALVASQTVNYNDIVTINTDLAGFTHWEEDGRVVSYNKEYKFSALYNKTLTAKGDGGPKTSLVTLSKNLELRQGSISRVAQIELSDNYELIEYGYLVSRTNEELTLENSRIVKSSSKTNTTNEYLTSIVDTYSNIRAYAKVKSNDVIENIYSELSSNPQISELFISEYGEGSSNNKWIEIYNGTNSVVDLSLYKVQLYSNGSTTVSNTDSLSGNLASGEVLVLYHQGSTQVIKDSGDRESDVMSFNGDDVITLVKDGTIIDTILNVGHPTNQKDLENLTLVRKSSIHSPNAVWDSTEWDTKANDYFNDIGSHTVSSEQQPIVTLQDVSNELSNIYTGSDNQESVTQDLNTGTNSTLLLDANITWVSDNPNIISNNGIVTRPKDADTTVNLTLTVSLGEGIVTTTYSLIVKKAISKYTVTFEDDGADVAVEPVEANENALIDEPVVTKFGYSLVGWFKDVEYVTPFDFNVDMITEDITIFAKWELIVEYTVTFVDNGADVSVAPQQVVENSLVDEPVVTKAGFTLVGWFTEAGFVNEFDFTTELITADITLYAQWIAEIDQSSAILIYGTSKYTGNTGLGNSANFIKTSDSSIMTASVSATNAYWQSGDNTLRLGSSKNNGTVTYTLTGLSIVEVKVVALEYDVSSKLTIGGTTNDMTSSPVEYTYNLSGVESFTLSGNKRVQVVSIEIVYE